LSLCLAKYHVGDLSCAEVITMPWRCMGEGRYNSMHSWPWLWMAMSG